MAYKILIVDDEKELADVLKDFLDNEGYETQAAYDGIGARKMITSFDPDLLILDIMLPDDDGMEICREVRNHKDIPIIMLSAKNTDVDKIIALGLGADDYLTKPYSPAVVVAHVKAHLRRYRKALNPTQSELIKKHLYMNKEKHEFKLYDDVIELKAKEFDLLYFLVKNEGVVYSKEALYDAVWGVDEFGELSTVTVHIRKIRSHIESKGHNPEFIKTIWGVGYKFEME